MGIRVKRWNLIAVYICSNWSYHCLELYTSICFVFDSSLRLNGVPCNNFAFAGQISVFSTFPPVVGSSTEPTSPDARSWCAACLYTFDSLISRLENYISVTLRYARPETNIRSTRQPFLTADWLELTNQVGEKSVGRVASRFTKWEMGYRADGERDLGQRIETTKARRIFLLSGGKHGNYLLYDGTIRAAIYQIERENPAMDPSRGFRRSSLQKGEKKKDEEMRKRMGERRGKAGARPWTKGGTTICNYVSFYPIPSYTLNATLSFLSIFSSSFLSFLLAPFLLPPRLFSSSSFRSRTLVNPLEMPYCKSFCPHLVPLPCHFSFRKFQRSGLLPLATRTHTDKFSFVPSTRMRAKRLIS